jgi:hypothetical protein
MVNRISVMLVALGVLAGLVVTPSYGGRDLRVAQPLCQVVDAAKLGESHDAIVEAILVSGREDTFLYDPECQGGKVMAWVDLRLERNANKKHLKRLVERYGRARVIMVGEMWGPRPTDARLTETFNYSPGWGHLGAYQTRFVARVIRQVEMVPEGTPWFMR